MEIDQILGKLGAAASKKSIERWLNNFEDGDRISALEILQRLRFVQELEQFEFAETIVAQIVADSNSDAVFYFCPIAKYGKSATQFSYYIGKSNTFRKLERQRQTKFVVRDIDIQSVVFDDRTVVIFFDDFFGTGGSFDKHFNKFKNKAAAGFANVTNIFAACGYYMEKAREAIATVDPRIKIVGDLHERIFGDPPMMFATASQIEKKKTLARKYADDNHLFKDDVEYHSLGYKGSEALLAFPYMPPNNTLPIIWSSNANWYPLLPRAHDDILRKLTEFRHGLAFASSKIELGLPEDFHVFNGMTDVKFILFGMLRMMKKQIPHPQIARLIGIPIAIFDKFMVLGKDMGYIGEDYKLTGDGEIILEDVIEQVKAFNEQKKVDTSIRAVKYMPKKIPRK